MKTLDKSWTKKDFKIDWFSGTGAGGQFRNKHQNCCRITHIESNISVTGQSHRERSRNFKEAFNELAKRLLDFYYTDKKERAPCETLVRTYNIAEKRITDHSTGLKFEVSDFDLDKVIGK